MKTQKSVDPNITTLFSLSFIRNQISIIKRKETFLFVLLNFRNKNNDFIKNFPITSKSKIQHETHLKSRVRERIDQTFHTDVHDQKTQICNLKTNRVKERKSNGEDSVPDWRPTHVISTLVSLPPLIVTLFPTFNENWYIRILIIWWNFGPNFLWLFFFLKKKCSFQQK